MVEAWGWRSVFFLNVPVVAVVLTVGPRVLTESTESATSRLPDPGSVLLLAGGVGLVSFGVVQTDQWGWTGTGTLLAVAAGMLAIGLFVVRSRRVTNPLFPLELFRINGVRWGNVGLLAYATGFAVAFFGNVNFLTGVWGWSVLRAGFAIAPGPLLVALLAPVAGRLAARYGQRSLLLPGGLVFCCGALWLLLRADVHPDYLGVFLPANLLTGLGVALCLPQLASVAVQQLPADQSATGSGISQSVRQVGQTFGVALFVAVLGTPGPGQALARFEHAWWLVIAGGLAVSLSALALRTPSRRVVLASASASADEAETEAAIEGEVALAAGPVPLPVAGAGLPEVADVEVAGR
jgi:MFS family permease